MFESTSRVCFEATEHLKSLVEQVFLVFDITFVFPSKSIPKSLFFELCNCAMLRAALCATSQALSGALASLCIHMGYALCRRLTIVHCSHIADYWHRCTSICALEVAKESLLSCSLPILRPRSYQSVTMYLFFTRLAFPKLPNCRHFRVLLPSCAVEVTKMSLFIMFFHLSGILEVTKVSLLSCPFSVLWTRSYQSFIVYFFPPGLRFRNY